MYNKLQTSAVSCNMEVLCTWRRASTTPHGQIPRAVPAAPVAPVAPQKTRQKCLTHTPGYMAKVKKKKEQNKKRASNETQQKTQNFNVCRSSTNAKTQKQKQEQKPNGLGILPLLHRLLQLLRQLKQEIQPLQEAPHAHELVHLGAVAWASTTADPDARIPSAAGSRVIQQSKHTHTGRNHKSVPQGTLAQRAPVRRRTASRGRCGSLETQNAGRRVAGGNKTSPEKNKRIRRGSAVCRQQLSTLHWTQG